MPVFENRHSFFFYVVKYWPKHFKLGYPWECDAILESTSNFVHSKQAVRSWNEVNWQLSNPISRRDRSFVSSLPVFSAHGLTTLVSSHIQEDVGSGLDSVDLCLALIEAARNGHHDVTRLLLQKAQINHATLQNALIAATSSGDEAVLTELIQHAAKISQFEWPPVLLSRAASLGLDKIGGLLLEFGAKVDSDALAPTFSPLCLAVERNHTTFVRMLLSRNAVPSIRGYRKGTVLHVAAGRGRLEIVKQLIEAGADVEDKDVGSIKPLEWALYSGNHAVVRELMNAGAVIRSSEAGDERAFIASAGYGFLNCVEIVLQYQGESIVQGLQEAALGKATEAGYVDVCRLLLQHGTNPNGSVGDRCILVQAVGTRKLELVKLLLEHGANVDLGLGSETGSALCFAARLDLEDITRLFIHEGARIDDVDAEGCTPLYVAASAGHHVVVRILLDANADVGKASKAQLRPLDVAYKYPEVVRMLLDSGADINRSTVFHKAAALDKVDTIQLLVSRDVNLET